MLKIIYHLLKPRLIQTTTIYKIHTTHIGRNNKPEGQVILHLFDNVKIKTKTTYVEMIDIFNNKDIRKRNHVDFIYTALKYMKEFGVEKDLEVYKELINILPKGKFIPTNMFQVEFMHYPRQQQCIIDVLEQMEDNGVIPDRDLKNILVKIFGRHGFPVRKYMRMLYWMPKFNNLSPWPLPQKLPTDNIELAKLALFRINSVDLQSQMSVFKTDEIKEALDHTWIVSCQSSTQKKLLNSMTKENPLIVEGPFKIWIRNVSVNYFILRVDNVNKNVKEKDYDDVSQIPVPFTNNIVTYEEPSVHEQNEGIILGTCATGTSSRDSLLSWIRILEQNNPKIGEIPILFTLRSPLSDVVIYDEKKKY